VPPLNVVSVPQQRVNLTTGCRGFNPGGYHAAWSPRTPAAAAT
jgi:hypothetical protein